MARAIRVELLEFDDESILFQFRTRMGNRTVKINRETLTPRRCQYKLRGIHHTWWTDWKSYPREGILPEWEVALQEAIHQWYGQRIF